ncbi:hypothetical protein IAT38_004542 [Cryptococcus sp. DSM 104549]
MSAPAPEPTAVPTARKLFPSNPFDVPETRELIQERIATGEITEQDVAVMERGYKWMIYTTPTTSAAFAFVVWQLMKQQYPRPRMITRLFWGGVSMGVGGMLGFGAAGVAAAMEVEDKLDDVDRKSAVFEEITEQSRILQQSRLALLRPTPPLSQTTPSLSSLPATAPPPTSFPVPASTPAPADAVAQQSRRAGSRLPAAFEYPEPVLVPEEQSRGVWGWVKSWVPGGKQ